MILIVGTSSWNVSSFSLTAFFLSLEGLKDSQELDKNIPLVLELLDPPGYH